MEIDIYITANIIYLVQELYLGDHIGCREVSCHHTLYWTPFSQCPLATSARCAANNLFICSSRTRYSHLSACWIWRWNNILHATKKVWGMRSEFNISRGMGQGTPNGLASAYYRMWADLNGFDPRKALLLGGIRIGMGCMIYVVTVISSCTQVPVTLRQVV